jgi:hypothetical protein
MKARVEDGHAVWVQLVSILTKSPSLQVDDARYIREAWSWEPLQQEPAKSRALEHHSLAATAATAASASVAARCEKPSAVAAGAAASTGVRALSLVLCARICTTLSVQSY